jgi:hypothetical protein
MAVAISYRGLLDEAYTLPDFVQGVQENARRRGLKTTLSFEPNNLGVYVWIHEKSEPLELVFLSHTHPLVLQGSTKTGYEYGQEGVRAHGEAKKLLMELNEKYFNGKLDIEDDAEDRKS